MRRSYLKTHKPMTYNAMLLSERLFPHLRKIQREAEARLEIIMTHFVESDPPPCKSTDSLAWAAHMDALKRSAEEIILAGLIYS